MKITNKKARLNFKLEPERYEAGISLTGDEVKGIKHGITDLSNSHAKFIKNEIFLINANIAKAVNPTRSRKLLLKRSEITSLATKCKQKKLTLVPIMLYTTRRLVKVKLALGKVKKKYEKRENLRKKAIKREIERELKK